MRLTSFAELAVLRQEAPRPGVKIRVKRPTRPVPLYEKRIEVHDPRPQGFPRPDCRKEFERIEDAIEAVARNRRLAR